MRQTALVLIFPILLGACAATTTLENEISKAQSGVAAVCTSAQRFLDTTTATVAGAGTQTGSFLASTTRLMDAVKDGLAANASSTVATTAAVASTMRELDQTLADLRPNLVAISSDAATTLANVRETTAQIKNRAEAPIPLEVVWTLRVVVAAVLVLLVHAVYLHSRKAPS